MAITNTRLRYGSVAKVLHWLTALGFLAAYCAIYNARIFADAGTDEFRALRDFHFLAGITAAMFIFPRVIWRLFSVAPELEPGAKWQHFSAHAAHWVLYAIMIVIPITGWMVRGGPTDYFGLFEVPGFRRTGFYEWFVTGQLGLTFEEFRDPIRYFHRDIAGRWMVWILIGIHAAAALYHHFALGDNTLLRMLPARRTK